MGPHRGGQSLQLVSLDEDERDAPPARLAQGGHALVAWVRRRPGLGVASVVLALVVLVGTLLVVPRVAAEHERRDVLAAGRFPEAVRTLAQAPRELWHAPARPSMTPVLVGDTIVVAADDPAHELVGLDVVTGEQRWAQGPLGTVASSIQGCTPAQERLACVIGTRGRGDAPAAHVVALDPTTGAVLLDVAVDGLWVEIAPVGRDVVLAGWTTGGLAAARVDTVTGAVRWRVESSQGVSVRNLGRDEAGGITVQVAGDVVLVSALPARLVLDADDGRSLIGDGSSRAPRAQDDNVRLQGHGTFVGIRYYLHDGVVGARSTLRDASGRRVALLDGEAVQPVVADQAPGRVLTVERGNGSVVVRAYGGAGPDLVWTSTEPDGHVVLDAAGRVVLARATSLVGLDGGSGARIWQRPLGASASDGEPVGSVFSDGRRIAVPVVLADGRRGLAAFDLDDGDLVWRVALPAGTVRVVRMGSQLYALAPDRVVALR